MGQARQRGTYEERLAAGKRRMAEREAERVRERAEREAAMTPAERKAMHERRMLLATMLGIAASANASFSRDPASEAKQGRRAGSGG